MEELSPEAKQIYDLLKVLAKEVAEERITAHRTSSSRAMAELVKDNDAKFAALHDKVDDAMVEIRKALDKIGGGTSSSSPHPSTPNAEKAAREEHDGQFGHRDDGHGRRSGVYVPPPARGTHANHYNPAPVKIGDDLFMECTEQFSPGPRVELPRFDGTHPRLWQSRCEEYYKLWGTPRSLWITYASAQFEGAAIKWLEAYKHAYPESPWEDFCMAL